MIYVNLKSGNDGVGVVGDRLTDALSRLTTVHRLRDGVRLPEPLPGPLLERIFKFVPSYAAMRNVAYCVFEDDLRMRKIADRARAFDVVVLASRWCETALREGGVTSVTTIHQGIDPASFNPGRAIRRRFHDRFVVFSGGKLELRKGQDIVISAFKVFAERHPDALLAASWQQPWTDHAATMADSPYVPFPFAPDETPMVMLRSWLSSVGINHDQVEFVSPRPHDEMAEAYGDTDVGLFPNRCEGGTNLVMMEYMACGKPVIATDFSGHRDVLTETNSFRLRSLRPLVIRRNGEASACWCEPMIDEIVACLERAYQRRDLALERGHHAARDLAAWSWNRAAQQFLTLLEG